MIHASRFFLKHVTIIGAPLAMIHGSESPWSRPEFPPVQPGHKHAVLYHVTANGISDDRPPKPQIGQDKWDPHHVRLPCSKQSLYQVTDNKGETRLRRRWAIIQYALRKPMRNCHDLINAILTYNIKFRGEWTFLTLRKFFHECLGEEENKFFFEVTLPQIANLALELPKLIKSPIPLLKRDTNMSISLSQQQIACLLANAFFCTFPRRNSVQTNSEFATYPRINFSSLYESVGTNEMMEKLKCICYYFRRVCLQVPVGVVTFERRSVPMHLMPRWECSELPISSVPLHLNPLSTIEKADGLIQVDFANKYLGGGVLGYGCVQEEIRFVICPELMVSMLFTESLKYNEAVMIIGAERYSEYTGYGHSFGWAGPFIDTTPRDCSGRRRVAVLAIDAEPYKGKITDEFTDRAIRRELNKAWVGFSFHKEDDDCGSLRYPGIATGNWGCGAFGGTASLKSLLQLMACVQAKRPMAYYTFGDQQLADEILANYNMFVAHNITVGQLFNILGHFCDKNGFRRKPHSNLHLLITQKINEGFKSATQKSDLSNSEKERMLVEDTLKNNTMDSEETPKNDINSPDIFLLDSEEQDFNIVKTVDEEINEKEMVTSDNKMAECENKMALETPSHSGSTSRLFEEMEKMDEDNGSLNLKSPHKSPLKQAQKSMEDETVRIEMDLPGEAKRKISRKITDYFSKKPI